MNKPDFKDRLEIFEATASLLELSPEVKPGEILIVRNISNLLRSFSTGDAAKVQSALDVLDSAPQHEVIRQVGQLARSLHGALKEFNASLTRDPHNMDLPSEHTDRLEDIMKGLADGTYHTVTLVQKQRDEIEDLKKTCEAIKNILHTTGCQESMRSLVESQEAMVAGCDHYNSEILTCQNFQDITRQSVKEVIKLVHQLEADLLTLLEHPEDPVPKPGTAKLRLDEVDDILTRLGF